jgi:hypothetical protein
MESGLASVYRVRIKYGCVVNDVRESEGRDGGLRVDSKEERQDVGLVFGSLLDRVL